MTRNHYMTESDCAARFPRLMWHMRRAACLTANEAAWALRDHLQGLQWSGEAVNHFGGIPVVIRHAIERRHWFKSLEVRQ